MTGEWPEGVLLVDEALAPDPDEAQELSGANAGDPVLLQETVRKARIQVRQHDYDVLDGPEGLVTATAFTVTFHATGDAVVSDAVVSFEFREPTDARILDLHPKLTLDEAAQKITVTRSGGLSVAGSGLKASGEVKRQSAFEVTPRIVQGSGLGSAQALWSFKAAPGDTGVPLSTRLALSLAGEGPFAVDLDVQARVTDGSLAAKLDRAQELIFGLTLQPIGRLAFRFPASEASGTGGVLERA